MRDDELRAIVAKADRPRAMTADEEAAVRNRIFEAQPVIASTAAREPTAAGRSAFWLTTAAALVVIAFGLVFVNRADSDQAALLPGATTVPCTVVGAELADAVEQWGSIDDWAIATNNPEPDVALLVAESLRVADPEADSSAILMELDAILDGPRRSGITDAMERADVVERALVELADVVGASDDSCLAPGLVSGN